MEKDMIVGGKKSISIGLDGTHDAGNDAFTGTPLYRETITPHIADVRKVDGQYYITRANGTHNMIYDEIYAKSKQQAIIAWYAARQDRMAEDYRQLAQASINRAAVKTVLSAVRKGEQYIEIDRFTSGGMVSQGNLDDIFATARMLGYEGVTTHSYNNIRYLILGKDASDAGKIKHQIDGR